MFGLDPNHQYSVRVIMTFHCSTVGGGEWATKHLKSSTCPAPTSSLQASNQSWIQKSDVGSRGGSIQFGYKRRTQTHIDGDKKILTVTCDHGGLPRSVLEPAHQQRLAALPHSLRHPKYSYYNTPGSGEKGQRTFCSSGSSLGGIIWHGARFVALQELPAVIDSRCFLRGWRWWCRWGKYLQTDKCWRRSSSSRFLAAMHRAY